MERSKCDFVSKNGKKCMRYAKKDGDKCVLHHKVSGSSKEDILNSECPICLENTEEENWLLLSCHHRAHENCLSGMNKLECPLCRAQIINLPKTIKEKIEKNRTQYAEEIIQEEEEDIRRMIEQAPIDPPPQLSILLALQYIHQLGVPEELIPPSVTLELDPGSPIPSSEYIFNQTVCRILEYIKDVLLKSEEDILEEDEGIDPDYQDLADFFDDENPFIMEGIDITRNIETIPIVPNDRGGQRRPNLVPRTYFNNMRFDLSNLPPIDREEIEELTRRLMSNQ